VIFYCCVKGKTADVNLVADAVMLILPFVFPESIMSWHFPLNNTD